MEHTNNVHRFRKWHYTATHFLSLWQHQSCNSDLWRLRPVFMREKLDSAEDGSWADRLRRELGAGSEWCATLLQE